ncbi:bifunctional 4-hydroxy-2-oxoglutarate aldolase/2-dehydro-3-deoxy-phosphogluconate aldolase [Anaerotignum sp. MB30-C6]|uniref:bifunctional 4-hydroxy-2-oxoglutarate aldolase/2-dehydro-3-deoxy-phosphogluconate aldolase n=1 Tax=Anaerotignum sp. MB30-C6 TaxID=3070814 RepID=UPI0027DBF0F2|nr:bifunctional 4-hydroxy-2-oxoglutarate aldolase/2-dehydro-3-deoxy-phosphogluconate aldolase [Anaerotignum sp. MB30-C6]WMI80258.1 bifunctional 4-hydroxy-2-oxoglutarate aldolase/2-dehydro-3-deoxy-phosphogluconate aldolase [Anaerotignum sp. MB30-C6]
MADTLQRILDGKVIAIVRGISSKDIIQTVQALKDGGITCVEVTFSLKSEEQSLDTLKSIQMIKKHFSDSVAVGAGTVLTPENVYRAKEAGAEYIISPNVDEAVIKATKRLGLVSIPGAVTPTEVITAYNWGADIVKLFPAATLGLSYIKALMGPIDGIPLTAVGGVDASNYGDFINAGCVGVGVGGNLVNKKLIEAGDFEAIKNLALEYGLK